MNKRLALVILILGASFLVFVTPKFFLTPDTSGKKMFLMTFLLAFGGFMCLLFAPKQKEKVSPSKDNSTSSRTYHALQDEITHYTHELQKHHVWWGYGPLIVGWAVLLIGKYSHHQLYSHPIFAIPIFALAFLAATKFIEEDNALDIRIAESILKGIKLERNQRLKLHYFQDLANSYEGWNMWIFAFLRVSPQLMILFSLFNVGSLSLFIDYLSQFFDSTIFPYLIINSSAGATLAMIALFYGKIACQPYRLLLRKLKTIEQT